MRAGFSRQPSPFHRARVPQPSVESLEGRRLFSSVVVNTTADVIFLPKSGFVSLRNAVLIANSSATPTSITFSPSVFNSAKKITLKLGSLSFSNDKEPTTIAGPTAGLTVADAVDPVSVEVSPDSALAISGILFSGVGLDIEGSGSRLTLTNVSVTGVNVDNEGGAITNVGTLSMTGGSLFGNHAFRGAGIFNAGVARLTGVSIFANSATDGAGIYNFGALYTKNVSIYANKATGESGGLYLNGDNGGTGTFLDTTISLNSAGLGNGGITVGTGASAAFTNVTIGNNHAILNAGGLRVDGKVTLYDSTISGNSANESGGGVDVDAGAMLTVVNTIIAGNTSGIQSPDALGAVASLGNNLIGKTNGSSGWKATDLTGTIALPLAAKLGPLAANGGPCQTFLPLISSPAINHGRNAAVPPGVNTDQRGFTRIVNSTVDIGAVEIQPSISGVVIKDLNANGKSDPGEPGLARVTIYIDKNNNQIFDAGETSAITDATGKYNFRDMPPGPYVIRQVIPTRYRLTTPTLGYIRVTIGSVSKTASNFLDALIT